MDVISLKSQVPLFYDDAKPVPDYAAALALFKRATVPGDLRDICDAARDSFETLVAVQSGKVDDVTDELLALDPSAVVSPGSDPSSAYIRVYNEVHGANAATLEETIEYTAREADEDGERKDFESKYGFLAYICFRDCVKSAEELGDFIEGDDSLSDGEFNTDDDEAEVRDAEIMTAPRRRRRVLRTEMVQWSESETETETETETESDYSDVEDDDDDVDTDESE